jgi:TonB family protein
MTVAEGKTVGTAIGCDFLVLVQSDTFRRSSFERKEYYESHAAVYVVSARSGRLVFWSLPKFEAPSRALSGRALAAASPATAAELSAALKQVAASEAMMDARRPMEELPAENSPEAKNFRAPIPFRRIKPEYTALASLFDITATVEIELDLDAGGTIVRAEIVRWAGYGLDQAVETAVRSMNWRPAERDGKPLPMRVLLRYNFRKFDK